jgi:dihydrofolate reductase
MWHHHIPTQPLPLAHDFESAVKAARQLPFHHQIFIIGGQSVYAAALASGEVDFISATHVDVFSRADMCTMTLSLHVAPFLSHTQVQLHAAHRF